MIVSFLGSVAGAIRAGGLNGSDDTVLALS